MTGTIEDVRQAIRSGRIDDEIATIICTQRVESDLWDYKEHLDFTSPAQKAELARDVSAFHNSSGGFILYGVRDRSWEITGCSQNALDELDQRQVNNFLRPYVGDRLTVLCRVCNIGRPVKRVVLIYVPPRNGRPVMMLRNGPQIGKSPMFREGDIYIRSGDSSCRVTTDTQLEAIWRPGAPAPPVPPSSDGWSIVEFGFRLPPKPTATLVGRDRDRALVLASLHPDTRWWITSIDGLGGVGKTALASSIVWDLYKERRYESIVSVTAKTRELSDIRILPLKPELVGIDSVVDAILETNGFQDELRNPLDTRISQAQELLQTAETLLFLDNLETVEDARVFDFLKRLPRPSRALVTSRKRPETGEDRIHLGGLSEADATTIVARLQAEQGIPEAVLTNDARQRIVRTSGGLPLAVHWLVGQVKHAASSDFLKTLAGEVPQVPEQVLEFSFRNMFTLLGEDQQTLLMLSALAPNEALGVEHYMYMTEWSRERVQAAISVLVDTSFFLTSERGGTPFYSVLPITAAFAHGELCRREALATTARLRLQEIRFRQVDAQKVVDYLKSLVHGKDEAELLAVGLAKAAAEEYAAGNYERGRQLFDSAEAYYNKSPYLFYTRATSEANAGNSAQAHIHFEKATRLLASPTSSDAVVWKMWGLLYKQEANWDCAIEKLAIATNLNDQDPYALHMLAFCHSMRKQYAAAERIYRKALAIIGDSNPTQRKLTLTSMAQNIHKSNGNLEEALNIVLEAQRLPGTNRKLKKLQDDIELSLRRVPRRR